MKNASEPAAFIVTFNTCTILLFFTMIISLIICFISWKRWLQCTYNELCWLCTCLCLSNCTTCWHKTWIYLDSFVSIKLYSIGILLVYCLFFIGEHQRYQNQYLMNWKKFLQTWVLTLTNYEKRRRIAKNLFFFFRYCSWILIEINEYHHSFEYIQIQ